MVAHVANATRFSTRPLYFLVDLGLAKLRHRGEFPLDGANQVGIDRLRAASTLDLTQTLRRAASDTRTAPRWLRARPISDPVLPSHATIGYFVDAILTRDLWLHRHDIARATGSPARPDPTDAEVVAQVVRRWTPSARPGPRWPPAPVTRTPPSLPSTR